MRLVGSSAWWSRICLRATSRLQLGVERDEDGAQAALGVRPEDAEPLAVAGGRCRRSRCRCGRRRRPRSSRARSRRGRASPRCPGRRVRARLSRVDLPAGTAARLFSTSPPCCLRCRSPAPRPAAAVVASDVAAGDQVVGQAVGTCRSVQAWKAATSWPWSIRPFCRASSPKSRSRSAAAAMANLLGSGTGDVGRPLTPGA